MKTIVSIGLFFGIIFTSFSQVTFNSSTVLNNPLQSVSAPKIIKNADLNNDGRLDLIVSNAGNKLFCFYNLGNGQFSDADFLLKDNYLISNFNVVDINNDNALDIITYFKSSLRVKAFLYLNDGSNQYTFSGEIYNEQNMVNICGDEYYLDYDEYNDFVYDFNFDGYPDVYFYNKFIDLNAQNQSNSLFQLPKGEHITGDIDNDGDDDILCFENAGFSWYEDNNHFSSISNNNFHIIKNNLYNKHVSGAELIDVDNDNDLDIILLFKENSNYNISWFENDGTGTFTNEHIILNTNPLLFSYKLADFNNDGQLDILTYNGFSSLYINSGNGNFTQQSGLQNIHPTGLTSFDFNNDNFNDIIYTNLDDNHIYLTINNHNGFDTPLALFDEGNILNTIAVDDLDNNNQNELYVGISNQNKLSIYHNIINQPTEQILIDTLAVSKILIEDLDVNNQKEIIIATDNETSYYNSCSVYLYSQTGNQLTGTKITDNFFCFFGHVNHLSAGYFWNANTKDIILTSSEDVSILYNDSQNNFTCTDITPIPLCGDVERRDYIKAGAMDIVNDNNTQNNIIFYDNATLSLKSDYSINIPIQTQANDYVIFDINNDTEYDFIGAGTDGLFITSALDHNNKVFIDTEYYNSLQLADLDNDGDKDIVVTSPNKPALSWFENLGNGNFGSRQIIDNTQNGFDEILTTDYDNDNDIDIFVTSKYDGMLVYFENQIISGFTTVKPDIFKIYPNPVANQIKIEKLKNLSINRLSIMTSDGKILKIHDKQPASNFIDVSYLSPGIYYLLIQTDNNIYSNQFIKK